MKVRQLIKVLLDQPMDAVVYVGKGMGPIREIGPEISDESNAIYVVIKP